MHKLILSILSHNLLSSELFFHVPFDITPVQHSPRVAPFSLVHPPCGFLQY